MARGIRTGAKVMETSLDRPLNQATETSESVMKTVKKGRRTM